MHYLTLSFTHKNTSIEVREKLSFGSINDLSNMLKTLHESEFINEVIILSTCNRVEIIMSVNDIKKSLNFVLEELSKSSKMAKNELENLSDIYENSGAVHHLFSVASSLDSLVVGETQIAGQLKNAYKFSFEKGFCSQKLSRLLRRAFRCAAKIRESTDISKSPVSVASVSVAMAKEMIGNLGGMSAIVVGAGEMASLVAKHLVANGVNIIILSRDFQKAQNLANSLGELASADKVEKLSDYINRYKIFFSATSSTQAVIKENMLKTRDYERYFFDIAVPRDIELTSSSNVHVYAVDDLQEIAIKNISLREKQAQKAYKIIREETMEFYRWLQSLAIEPIIKDIRMQVEECSRKEIEKARKKGYIKNCSIEEVERLVHQVFQAFLHSPTTNLKAISKLPQSDSIIQAIQYFFDINEDHTKYLNHYKCEYEMEKDI